MKTRYLMAIMTVVLAASQSSSFADAPTQLTADQLTMKTAAIYPTVNVRAIITAADKYRGVIYFTTAEQREQRRIIIFDDMIYDHTGALFTYTNQNAGEINYVMDNAGNFYWLDESTDATIRHDTIFDKGPVTGGGNLIVLNSKLIYIDCDSGHYPTSPLFPDVINELTKDGNDMTKVKQFTNDNSDPIFHKPSKSGAD